MLLVLPGALPDSSIAGELARRLPQRAPTLHAWLSMGQAAPSAFDTHANGCTPYEAWQLGQAGHDVDPDDPDPLPWGAGLGPLLAGARACRDGQAVWLGELVHLALGTDRVTLLPADQMDLNAEESQALFEAAQPLFQGTGFAAEPLNARRWRLRLPDGLRPKTASPDAVAGQPLDAWWQHDAAMRPWRRLLNEIQMVWHEHPVNQARAERGAAPVNAIWLYGGAWPWFGIGAAGTGTAHAAHTVDESDASRADAPDAGVPKTPAPDQARVYDNLLAPHRAGDWAMWLDALEALDRDHLAPLAQGKYRLPASGTRVLLLGADRRTELRFKPRLLRWLPPVKTHNWNTWWSRPV